MRFISFIKAALHRSGIHPRRWLCGLVSYSRYIGYIRPHLLRATEEEFRVRRQLVTRAWEPRRLVAPVGKRILALCPPTLMTRVSVQAVYCSPIANSRRFISYVCPTAPAVGASVRLIPIGTLWWRHAERSFAIRLLRWVPPLFNI
jgi:hypothetical protein